MAHRWLRGVLPTHDPVSDSSNNYINNQREFCTIVYYFLHRVLGWTLVDEVIASGGSFQNNHSATGTDGVLSNASYIFTSATASFTAGDVGKFLCLVDSTSDLNCGIYVITGWIDANNVAINFYTTAGNYPETSTGITWYLLDPTNVPTAQDSYFVLETPHATVPTTLKFEMKGYNQVGSPGGANLGLFIEYAGQPASEAWDAISHAWKTAAKYNENILIKISSGAHSHNPKGRVWGYGNTDGSCFCMWTHFVNGTEERQVTIFSVLTPFETGRSNAEKVCLFGPWYNTSDAEWSYFDINEEDFGSGQVWSEIGQQDYLAYITGFTYNGTSAYFRTNVGGPNARTGKRDALPLWVVMDPENNNDIWAPLGAISSNLLRAQVIDLGEDATFDSDQYYHIIEGLVVPWPGIPSV